MVNFQKILTLFILLPIFVFSQNNEQSVYVYGIGAIPLSDFSDNIGESIEKTRRNGFDYGEFTGLAKFGYGIGTDFTVPVLVEGLGWQLSAKLIFNPTDKTELEKEFTSGWGGDTNKVTFDVGAWINIPLFTGFSYGYKLSDFLNVYANLQAGLNLTQQPTREVFVNGERAEKAEFDLIPDFGLEAGIGFEILDSYLLSLRYLNLSNPRYPGTRTLNENYFSIPRRELDIDSDEKPISMLLITLGVKL
jgi:hypothetical protein